MHALVLRHQVLWHQMLWYAGLHHAHRRVYRLGLMEHMSLLRREASCWNLIFCQQPACTGVSASGNRSLQLPYLLDADLRYGGNLTHVQQGGQLQMLKDLERSNLLVIGCPQTSLASCVSVTSSQRAADWP